jgi:hypothetical protein
VTWWLDLKNPHAIAAIGVFALAVNKQGANTGATCTNASCRLAWDSQKMTGQHAVESLGNVVTIPAFSSYRIYQTDSTENLAEVGCCFAAVPQLPPSRVDTAWRSDGARSGVLGRHSGTSTVSKFPAALIGQTNDGTAVNSNAEVCLDPTDSHNSKQTCTSWCYGGDTLVFGFAAEATSLADDITSVTFNTGGATPQNIPLTPFIVDHKYPTAGSANGPPTDIYSSIWYARNPDFLSNPDARSGARVTGSAGTFASFTGSIGNNSTVLTVASWSGSPLQVGNVIAGGIDTGTKICAFLTGTGGNGTYTVSASGSCSPLLGQSGPHNNKAMTVSTTSSVLTVTAAAIPGLAVDDQVFGTGIAPVRRSSALAPATGGTGTYNLSSSQQFASTTISSNGLTVTSATGTVAPVGGTILSVKSGTGAFAAGVTAAASSPAPSATAFALSQRPTTPLEGATICGGTCAFFVHGGTTQYTLAKTPSNFSWASGFVCLKGVDIEPQKVTSSRIASKLWREVVQ